MTTDEWLQYMLKNHNSMYALLCTIAVFSSDEEYAKQAEEMVKRIREE